MLGAEDGFDYQIFDFGHNYNKTSREAVYGFFGRWLLGNSGSAHLEQPYTKEADADLRVFPNGDLPDDALNEQEFIQPVQPVEAWQERLPCLEPIVTLTGIEIALQQLLEHLCKRLEQEQKGIRTLHLHCHRVDDAVIT